MQAFALVALSGVLAYALVNQAGVLRAEWYLCAAAVGVIAAAYYAAIPSGKRAPLGKMRSWLLGVFAGLAVIQAVPLPLWMVGILSPARAEQVREAARALGGLRWAALSEAPAVTLEHAMTLGACALVFLLTRELTWRSGEYSWRVVAPLVALGMLEAALGLLQAWLARVEGVSTISVGTYNNRNHFAGLLEMTLPLALLGGVALWKSAAKRGEGAVVARALGTCALVGAAAVMLLAVVGSLSRMGFLASLGSLFVVGALAFGGAGGGNGGGAWRRYVPVGLVGAAVAGAFIFLPTDELIGRFAEIAQTDEISRESRAAIWRNSMDLVKSYPAAGCGLGAYEPSLLRFQKVAPMYTVNFAHNDYLQILAEMGAGGFLAGMLLVVIVMRSVGRAAMDGHGGAAKYLALGCAGALAAMLLHSLVDFNLYIPANAMTVAWVAGTGDILGEMAAHREWEQEP